MDYFVGKPDTKEGWKFWDCIDDEVWDALRFLVPLTNPMKPGRVTIWVASTVVKCIFQGKKVSWARVFEVIGAAC
jgi:hypothetical protein